MADTTSPEYKELIATKASNAQKKGKTTKVLEDSSQIDYIHNLQYNENPSMARLEVL
jgi:hypothetical protein